MNDLQLWRLLQQDPLDEDQLAIHLEQLASEPEKNRFPYIGFAPRLLEHDSPRLRQAALRLLAGMNGFAARRLLVKHLDDADDATRYAAVAALAQSSASDPPRFVHALFHPDAHVRQYALEHSEAAAVPHWYLLYLLEDDDCAPLVQERLAQMTNLAAPIVPLLCAYAKQEKISPALARRLIAKIPWQSLIQEWTERRQYAECQRIINEAENATEIPQLPEPLGADILDDVFDLFWQEDAENEIEPESGDPLRPLVFAKLRDYMLSSGASYWEDVIASLVVNAVRHGRWTVAAVDICVLFNPRSVLWKWLPIELRREALSLLYTYGPMRRGTLVDADARHILESPFCRRPSGHLDLWIAGAVLHLVAANPIQHLLDWFDLPVIIEAFWDDIDSSVSLLSREDASERGTQFLLDEINKAHPLEKPLLMCLLIRLRDDEHLTFLAKLSAGESVAVFEELVRTAEKSGLSLSDKKRAKVAKYLANRIIDGDPAQFLQSLLAQPIPEECSLGQLILARVAKGSLPERIVAIFQALDPPALRKSLEVVTCCAGFPYEVETRLALALREHDEPAVRAWAVAKLPAAQRLVGEVKDTTRGIQSLKSSVVETIRTCLEKDLATAVLPCLKVPKRGLCAALADRHNPALPQVEVCAALLGCQDAADLVDEQFFRFSIDHHHFLHQLEILAADTWRYERRLPLIGQAWLYRWQGQCFGLQERWTTLPDDVIELLKFSQLWRSALLRRRLWQAVADVLAVWRWHDRERLEQVGEDAFGSLLIERLTTTEAESAASMLLTVFDAGVQSELVEKWRTRIEPIYVDLPKSIQKLLHHWIQQSSTQGAPVALRPVKQELSSGLVGQIRACTSLKKLMRWCRSDDVSLAEEAALQLVGMGEPGVAVLAELLSQPARLPASVALAVSVSLWPDGPTRCGMKDVLNDDKIHPEIRFFIGVAFMELEDDAILAQVFASAREETDPSWFRPEDWDRLLRLGVEEVTLALELAISPHPHAYRLAAQYLMTRGTSHYEHGEAAELALQAFLDAGTSRQSELRKEVALHLFRAGNVHGWPILLTHMAVTNTLASIYLFREVPISWLKVAIDAFLFAGPAVLYESHLLDLLNNSDLDEDFKQEVYQRLLSDSQEHNVREQVVRRLDRSPARAGKLRRVAETYVWGIHRGRELTGRMFQVEMIYDSLGYTRLEENKLYITPLPILRGDRHAREIVEGLLLHEIGHHVYHRGPEKQEVWQKAQDQNLHELLNLVSDEHLERNLRAVDEDFGDRLKKLCAFAFQHSAKEILVEELLRNLRTNSFAVLTMSRLGVARRNGCVQVESGKLLAQMEKAGLSFARFMRALRMGLGNRHDDPKVAAGLALFKNNFRQSTMADMYRFAQRLREIFGHETKLLQSFSQDSLLQPGDGDMNRLGDGITDQDIQREVRRVLNPGKHDRRAASGETNERWINVNPNEQFDEITDIVPLQHNPAAHAVYSRQVQRHAQKMRRYLDELGVALQLQRQRSRGKLLDRTRLRSLLVSSDPRILMAREPVIHTDLFLGVVIDCSGSMQTLQNIEKAKLFGTMLAEATKGHAGVDLRLFGFTEREIFDAGTARRCAVHDLRADGGNNDAAGLWHAAREARTSRRRAKLLVMISDGLPTQCSVAALRGLVDRLTRRWNMCCAQVAVQPLEEICFPHYILLDENDLDKSVRLFGQIMAKLVKQALRGR